MPKKKGSVQQVTLDAERLAVVARNAKLEFIGLQSCSVENVFVTDEEEMAPDHALDAPVVVGYDRSPGAAAVVIRFAVYATHRIGDADAWVKMVCETQWNVTFSGFEVGDDEEVCFFAQRTGMMTAYPYFRTFFAQTAWSSGANLPPLPMMVTARLPRPVPLATIVGRQQAAKKTTKVQKKKNATRSSQNG